MHIVRQERSAVGWYRSDESAYEAALGRYFALYLQSRGKLRATYAAFRDRPLAARLDNSATVRDSRLASVAYAGLGVRILLLGAAHLRGVRRPGRQHRRWVA